MLTDELYLYKWIHSFSINVSIPVYWHCAPDRRRSHSHSPLSRIVPASEQIARLLSTIVDSNWTISTSAHDRNRYALPHSSAWRSSRIEHWRQSRSNRIPIICWALQNYLTNNNCRHLRLIVESCKSVFGWFRWYVLD